MNISVKPSGEIVVVFLRKDDVECFIDNLPRLIQMDGGDTSLPQWDWVALGEDVQSEQGEVLAAVYSPRFLGRKMDPTDPADFQKAYFAVFENYPYPGRREKPPLTAQLVENDFGVMHHYYSKVRIKDLFEQWGTHKQKVLLERHIQENLPSELTSGVRKI